MGFQKKLIVVGIALFLSSVTAVRPPIEPNDNISISWGIKDDFIEFFVQAKTKGWIGIGLNTENTMNGADLAIGGVQNDVPYLQDYHGVSHRPVLDRVSNWKIGSVPFSEKGNSTTVSFKRALKTGDDEDLDIAEKELYLLWAYGADDNVMQRHVDNGFVKIQFLYSKYRKMQ